MRTIILSVLLGLTGTVQAWELVNPANIGEGAVTTTTVVDTVLVGFSGGDALDVAPNNRSSGVWIAFADHDVWPVCGQIGAGDPNNPQRGTLNRRFVKLQESADGGWLAAALFARAHNQRVRVKIRYAAQDGICRVVWFETCTTPESCQPFQAPVNP